MKLSRKEGDYGVIRPLLFSLLLLFGGILLGYTLFGGQETVVEGEKAAEQQETGIPVLAHRISRGTIDSYSRYNAALEPDRSHFIFPQLSGEVSAIYVQRGDQVESGEILFRLQGREVIEQRKQAEASLKQAEAELARLKRGARSEEIEQARAVVEQAEASLRGAREVLTIVQEGYEERFSSRQQLLNAENQLENAQIQQEIAKLQHRQADSAYADAEDAYERIKYLYDRGAVSEREYRSTKTQYEQAEIQRNTTSAQVVQAEKNLKSAREIYDLARETHDRPLELKQQLANARMQVETAEANLASARAQYDQIQAGPTTEELESVRAQVEYTEHALEIAISQEQKLTVKSPAEGLVSQINIEKGELTSGQAQTPPLVIISPELLVHLHVSEEVIPLLSRGEIIELNIPAVSKQLAAEITDLGVARDPDAGGFPVKAELKATSPSLRAGMYASVRLPERRREDVPLLPREAVVRRGGSHTVYVLDRERNIVHQRNVDLGIEQEAYYEVRSGLEAGELVVTRGLENLTDGARVEVISVENN